MRQTPTPRPGQDPGWYPYFNGVRFFDGQEWSDQIALAPATRGTSVWTIALGVMLGVLASQIIAGLVLLFWIAVGIYS